MSSLLMRVPRKMRSPARKEKFILPAVDPRDRLPSILQKNNGTRNYRCPDSQGGLQKVERAGIREIFCEMLVTSIWKDGDGSVRKEGKNRVEDHNSTT
jgi:hypothetical protein